jgi:transcriptional regulator with XRE-family HTH domain
MALMAEADRSLAWLHGEMKKKKQARLEAHGWRFGSAQDLLKLTSEEAAFVETKLALSRSLRDWRTAQRLSQSALAKRLRSSQSRVAKMEAADSTVSIDLLLRALFALGAQPRDVALAIRKRPRFRNRSQAVEAALAEKLERLARTRLARECAKLDPAEEQRAADEGLAASGELWSEY